VHSGVDVQRAELATFHAAFQNAAHQCVTGLNHFLKVKRCKFRKIAALTGHQFVNATGVGVGNFVQPHRKRITHQIGRAAGEVAQLVVPGRKPAGNVFTDHRFEQRFFAGVVQKQRAFGHIGACGHFFHLGSGVAFFHKQAGCGLQQLGRACLFAPSTAGYGAGRRRGGGCHDDG